jgi:hypothetical protein
MTLPSPLHAGLSNARFFMKADLRIANDPDRQTAIYHDPRTRRVCGENARLSGDAV